MMTRPNTYLVYLPHFGRPRAQPEPECFSLMTKEVEKRDPGNEVEAKAAVDWVETSIWCKIQKLRTACRGVRLFVLQTPD